MEKQDAIAANHPPPRPEIRRLTDMSLVELGIVSSAFATVQIDLNVVRSVASDDTPELTLCDHNCTTTVQGVPTGGSYTCPAAMSLNRGAHQTNVAPADLLIDGLRTAIDGVRLAQQTFLATELPTYLKREGVPERLHRDFTAALSTQAIVVNLFGGSPETHPEICRIVAEVKEYGANVHLTTTGRRIIQDAAFRADLGAHAPDLIGVSADDFSSPDEVDQLFALTDEELSRRWRSTSWRHGQRRKALEAVQLCRLAERGDIPNLLFNLVLHTGNLGQAPDLLDRLSWHTEGRAILNPYPVQTAFLGDSGNLDSEAIEGLCHVVDEALKVHLDHHHGQPARWNLAPRLGYWILMQALLERPFDARTISDDVAGAGVWRCYGRPGAGRCVQVGAAPAGRTFGKNPGGHLGCFWNRQTITDERKFWNLTSSEVAAWTLYGRQAAAAKATQPCRGCLFPRISNDAVSLELGLAPSVARHYRTVRARYLGY